MFRRSVPLRYTHAEQGGTASLFDFNGSDIRVIEIDGEPWFVGADACRSLSLKPHKTNGSFANHFRRLDDDERQPTPIEGRVMTVVSEAGLYKLIARSKKPEARAFDRWVRHVVLPAIRKDGGYVMGEEKVATEEDLLVAGIKPPCYGSRQGERCKVALQSTPCTS
ncbi:Bro-N domain-containing protein [Mameliella sp.]|uniref:BRO-N domain-containing protein n=1 Tax=Mameliella sp. TaxID=1924940 RepID=UPI003B512D9F